MLQVNRSIVSEAFSAGLGFALGLTMAQYMFKTLVPLKPVRQLIVCLKCGGRNSIENKFCWHCGEALHPPQFTNCPKCGFFMPSNMKFCWKCGSLLKR